MYDSLASSDILEEETNTYMVLGNQVADGSGARYTTIYTRYLDNADDRRDWLEGD